MANYKLDNFINIPLSGQTLEPKINIYKSTGALSFSIDPYLTTFVQKSKYVYIIIQNNIVYNNTLDFASTEEAIDALVELNQIKSLYLNSTYNGGADYFTEAESDDRYFTKTYISNNYFNKTDLTNGSKILSLSALTIGNVNVLDVLNNSNDGFSGISTVDIFGIKSGDTFNKASTQQMWNKLLNPYLIPNIILTSNTLNIYEIGTPLITSSFNFSWNTLNSNNVLSNSLSIIGPKNNLNISDININNLPANGNITTTVNITSTNFPQINQKCDLYFTISGLTSNNSKFSNNLKLSWKYRIYYGTYPFSGLTNNNNLISNNTINDLILNYNWIKEYADDRNKIWYQDGNGEYVYFCYPKVFGDLEEMPFFVGNFIDTGWKRSEMYIETSGGYTGILYYIYRKSNKTFGKSILIQKK